MRDRELEKIDQALVECKAAFNRYFDAYDHLVKEFKGIERAMKFIRRDRLRLANNRAKRIK